MKWWRSERLKSFKERRFEMRLVPKLELGNALVLEAPASQTLTKQSFADTGIPKLELGSEVLMA